MRKITDWLLGPSNLGSVDKKSVQKGYAPHRPSIADQFSVVDFCDEQQVFLFADGISMGSGFELGDISAEASPQTYLEIVHQKLTETFANVVPLYQKDPWVMQVFVNDAFSLTPVLKHIKNNISENILNTSFTQDYLQKLSGLFDQLSRPEGLFIDPKTGFPYRGRRRRIRVLFYRKYENTKTTREEALTEHLEVISQVEAKLSSPGLKLKRLTGKDYYRWWVQWFNPKHADKALSYPNPKPAGFNLTQNIFLPNPDSDEHGFYFDDIPHRVLYVDGLHLTPEIGLISRERQQANPSHHYALLDTLPEGAIYTIQVTFGHDEAIDAHLTRLEKGIVGTRLKPQRVREEIKLARDQLTSGNRLFWVNQAVFFRAENSDELDLTEKRLHQIFHDAHMTLLASKDDVHPLNSYLNLLPFNFVPAFARKYLCYDRLMYTSELAALLPVYGRTQGTKHLPCLTFFNRLGEPVFFDFLHSDFISQNSHLAIFANSGGGKSVLTGWLIYSLMAMKNARVVVFEMGNSFDRLLTHIKAHGKQTRQLLLSNQKDKAVPLNPFCDAYKALLEISETLDEHEAKEIAKQLEKLKCDGMQKATSAELTCDASRSYLAELALALRTMITEANTREEEGFTLADETLLIEILSDAIVRSAQHGVTQLLTEHICLAFERRIQTEVLPKKKERIQDMSDRLKSYVISASKSRFFNVPTEPLDDFDIFHIDISAIKDDRGKLALVMVSLLPRILAMAERTQNDNRPMFLIIDEAHLQFEIDVIVSYATLIAKVARKLGLWLIPVTQNIADMSSVKATKILSLIETWIALGLDENEIKNIKQFKALTPEQEHLIRSIESQKGLYAEAVLLGARHQGLFRIIPPRYLLALLMTEKHEKAERHQLEEEHGVLKAAKIMAEKLGQIKQQANSRDYFYDEL